MLKLASGDPIYPTNYNVVMEGKPYNSFYLKEYAGVDRETGKPLWYKGETGTETTSNYNEATERVLGSPDPKVFGGFGTSFAWKGLDASLSFNYRLGAKVYDSGAPFTGWGMATEHHSRSGRTTLGQRTTRMPSILNIFMVILMVRQRLLLDSFIVEITCV